MNCLPKGTVTIPPHPRKGADVLRWAMGVNKSLQQLRDRIWTVPTGPKKSAAASHPWKVTCSEDDATVAAGFISKIITKGTPGVDSSAWDFVEIPTEYDGTTTLTTLPTGTSYIYAKIGLTDINHAGGSEIMKTNPPDGILETENHVYQTSGAITVYSSTNAPTAEGTGTTTNLWIIPIAQVEVTDGIAAVTKQYLRENRTMHMTLFTMQPV